MKFGARCDNCRWVCEDHRGRPWDGPRACTCGGAGVDNSFPESLTSTPDGSMFVGSLNLGGVVKVRAGAPLLQFVQPGANGSRSVLGVAADAEPPCPVCNPSEEDNPPAMPEGFVADLPEEDG
jgi:hypothetical protein